MMSSRTVTTQTARVAGGLLCGLALVAAAACAGSDTDEVAVEITQAAADEIRQWAAADDPAVEDLDGRNELAQQLGALNSAAAAESGVLDACVLLQALPDSEPTAALATLVCDPELDLAWPREAFMLSVAIVAADSETSAADVLAEFDQPISDSSVTQFIRTGGPRATDASVMAEQITG